MKKFRYFLITFLMASSRLASAYWDQIGTNSQVTPPVPTSKIAEENAETQASKAAEYTIQKSLIDNLRTQVARSGSQTASVELMSAALDRIRLLGTSTTQSYVEQALDEPSNALIIFDRALAELDQWYSNLPGFP